MAATKPSVAPNNRPRSERILAKNSSTGATTATNLFGEGDAVGQTLQLRQVFGGGPQSRDQQRARIINFKIVGVLRGLTEPRPFQITAIWVGVAIGFAIELARKAIHANAAYQRFAKSGRAGFATEFTIDAIVLPSPYAVSFGGFVNLNTSLWFGAGGIASSAFNAITRRKPKEGEALPEDMSTTSLFGGGLIAGDALAALGIGIVGLVSTVLFAR